MPWFARRITVAIALAWAAASIVVVSSRFIPAPPADVSTQLALDRSLPVQYLSGLANLLHGNFGTSLRDGSSVGATIARCLPWTLELMAAAGLLAMFTGLPVGLIAGMHRSGTIDALGATLSDIARAVPAFLIGSLLLLLVGVWRADIVLPAITLAIGLAAVLFRTTRAATADIAQGGFVRAARGKGLPQLQLLVHHVLRNALMPIVSAMARYFGALMGSTVLVEYVFNFPGIAGRLVDAVSARDYPEVQGIVMMMALLSILVALMADLLRGALDPRIRTT